MSYFACRQRSAARALRVVGLFATLAIVASGCTWTVRASVSGSGLQSNAGSIDPVLSSDGRFVAFQSEASNLVPGDMNNLPDVFVRDNLTGAVELVSVASDGTQTNGNSFNATIDDDGRYVAFHSLASNLVPGDTNGIGDLFVHDRAAGTTERVPAQTPAGVVSVFSGDGRYLVYDGGGINVYYREAKTSQELTAGSVIDVSDDGRYIALNRGALPNLGTYLYDRQTATLEPIVPEGFPGAFPGGAISGDARFIVYNKLVVIPGPSLSIDVELLDRATGTTQPVATSATANDISDDGRFIVFSPRGPSGEEGEAHVFDRVTGRSFAAARTAAGGVGNRETTSARISDDGRYVAFDSFATNIVPADTNDTADVFVRAFPEPEPSTATPASVARGTTTTITFEGDYLLPSSEVAVSGNGVSVDSVAWISERQLSATITVAPDATPGQRLVLVTIAGTGAGHGSGATGVCNCLTVV